MSNEKNDPWIFAENTKKHIVKVAFVYCGNLLVIYQKLICRSTPQDLALKERIYLILFKFSNDWFM